jgi:hypothetical protein
MQAESDAKHLFIVKIAHTAVWGGLAGCILAIPVFASMHRLHVAAILISIVLLEVIVLLINGFRCPLTDLAERYTEDRWDNFDIFLPEWVARHNKTIFGILYLAGIALTLAVWLRAWL